MESIGFALFETVIGACGIAWGPGGIVGIQLPERGEAATIVRLGRRFPDARRTSPPPAIAAAIGRIAAFLAGGQDGFEDVPLDLGAVGAFERAVYRETRAIPAGQTATYGEIAARIGGPGAGYDAALPRAVGQALGRNPWPIVIPCHRVTAADGRIGGFSAPGGRATKLKLLEIEGALGIEALPLFAPAAAGR
jgi:methylated-DNA-[protein]-cysteine S-methyltransferase